MKTFNYFFVGILLLMIIGSSAGLFIADGFTPKIVAVIVGVIAVTMITSGIRQGFFIREKETDERNLIIGEKAKAKAFDMMGIVFGILIIAYGMLEKNLTITLLAFAAYLFIFLVYLFFFTKFHKEM